VIAPAVEQPRRAGEFRFAIWPFDRIPIHFPQNGVGEAACGSLRRFHEFHRFMNDGVGGETLEVSQLENGDPERLPHFGIEFAGGFARIVLNQVIELGPKPERPEYNLTRQTRVPRIQILRSGPQSVRCVSASFDLQKDFEGGGTAR
jgi:hypothetical protein